MVKTIAVYFAVLGLFVFQEAPSDDKIDFKQISNRDIQFDGTFVGLMPSVKGNTKMIVAKARITKPDPSPLIELLEDPNKYVAAHIVLTMAYSKSIDIQVTHWNGLEVDIHAIKGVSYPPNQMDRLKKEWEKRLAKKNEEGK